MGRRVELDALRGLMLVWITLTHLPTAASTYVNQPFGFVSAAEGFIFLSALFTGRIYFRQAEHDGYLPMVRKLWTRTLRLYGYHGLLLVFVFLVAVPIASRGNRNCNQEDKHQLEEHTSELQSHSFISYAV